MSASDQLVRIGNGRMLHLLASYNPLPPTPGLHGRAACGAKGRVTSRYDIGIDVLASLDPCPQCTKVATDCARWLTDHRRIFRGAA